MEGLSAVRPNEGGDDIAAENHEGSNDYTSKVPNEVRPAYPEAIYDE